MWYYWVLFIFLAFVSKALLAFAMIYLLLPNDRLCAQCDGETLLVRPNRPGRVGAMLSLGRVQWRWCPRCGWEGMARRVAYEQAPSSRQVRQESRTGG